MTKEIDAVKYFTLCKKKGEKTVTLHKIYNNKAWTNDPLVEYAISEEAAYEYERDYVSYYGETIVIDLTDYDYYFWGLRDLIITDAELEQIRNNNALPKP